MQFIDPALQGALTQWRAIDDSRERAMADNLWFEERIGPARQELFEAEAEGADNPDRLRNSQIAYFETFVKVDVDLWPHTFLPDLEPADLGPGPLEPFQPIVRLEDLRGPLEAWAPTDGTPRQFFEMLQEAVADPSRAGVVAKFVQEWNRKRDRRPVFAAWKDQLLDELAQPDWPDLLRDRMGLAHYDCRNGPMPVALVEYLVQDVIVEARSLGLTHAFTAPTVLDGRPWPHFFPAPKDLPYGRAMPLQPVDDENRLLAEMLHVRITYRPEHIVRLGQITRPPGPTDMKELRNSHLLALQAALGHDGFGEYIP